MVVAGCFHIEKFKNDTATQWYDSRSVPVRVEQSVGCGQVTGQIKEIKCGEHGESVTATDAGVLHDCHNFELDFAGAHRLRKVPPANDTSFNRMVVALSCQSQPITSASRLFGPAR